MPTEFSPRQFQKVLIEGFNRTKWYRSARMMFMREYVGRYYGATKGTTGDESLNLIFNTIRAIVPAIVMKNPVNDVITDFADFQNYAFLLGKGIDLTERRLKFSNTLRAGLVGAFFGMGLFKTGIAESGQLLYIEDIAVDPGAVYCDLVDLDNLCFDPTCTEWEGAAFIGDRIRVPRQILLDTDGWDHDLVMKLPQSGSFAREETIKDLSQKRSLSDMDDAMDYVDVVESWVPGADTVVYTPDPFVMVTDKYLHIRDYYGPKSGPYTKLALTQPVPNNPLPIAPVSVWYDLHIAGNRMFKKIMEQADRQKDIGIYNPAAIDAAEDIREAEDGEMVAGDPTNVKVVSFGGQNNKNEMMLQQLQIWYNYVAGNPDQIAGLASNADTATQAQILQGNASLSMSDMQDMVYDCAADIGSKIAWYLHYDPFVELPIAVRKTGGEARQLWLTPEQRRGDFLHYAFRIVPKSMNRLDPQVQTRRILDFATNIVPAVVSAAVSMMQIGQPFNIADSLSTIADKMEIGEFVRDWFFDPEFQQKIQFMMQMGPQDSGKASVSPKAVSQNNGYPMQRNILSPTQQFNRNSQMGAQESQRNLKVGGGF